MADTRIDSLLQHMQRMDERSDQILQYVKQIDKRLRSIEATGQPSSSSAPNESHTEAFHTPAASQPAGGTSAISSTTGTTSYVNNGSAYELLATSGLLLDGKGREVMDFMIQHLQAQQARHELAHLGSSDGRRAGGTGAQGLEERGGRKGLRVWLRRAWIKVVTCCHEWDAPLVACGYHRAPRIHPMGRLRLRWQLANFAALLACAILSPLWIAFADQWLLGPLGTFWLLIELSMDACFCADTCLSAVTSYYREGRSVLESDPRKVFRHYLGTWGVVDLAASLPLAPLLIATGVPASSLMVCAVRLLKLERVAKLATVVHDLRRSRAMQRLLRSVDPAHILLAELFSLVLLMWHWLACLWFYISSVNEAAGGTAIDLDLAAGGDATAAQAASRSSYVISFHWVVSVTTGLGAPIRALTQAQSLFESATVCLGIVMQSFVFGTVASAVGQVDEGARARQRKLEAVKNYVRFKRVPMFVRERVVDFYEYVLGRVRPAEEAALLADLPSQLRLELAIVVNRPLISKVDCFKGASPGAVALLALLVGHQTHTPDENILFEGEPNSTLYFVRSGELRVYVHGGMVLQSFSTKVRQRGGHKQQKKASVIAQLSFPKHDTSGDELLEAEEGEEGEEGEDEELAGVHKGAAAPSQLDRPPSVQAPSALLIAGTGTGTGSRQQQRRKSGSSDGSGCSSNPPASPLGSSPSPLRKAPYDGSFTKLMRRGWSRSPAAVRGSPTRPQSSSPEQSPERSARVAFRSIVQQVVALNREVATEAEEARRRIQEIKDSSVLDVAKLGTAVGTMTDGATFGEQSFLTGKPSGATVRTVTFCEIMSLRSTDLDIVSEAYPDLRNELERFGQQRAASYKERNQRAFTRRERKERRPSLSSVVPAMVRRLSTSQRELVQRVSGSASGTSNDNGACEGRVAEEEVHGSQHAGPAEAPSEALLTA